MHRRHSSALRRGNFEHTIYNLYGVELPLVGSLPGILALAAYEKSACIIEWISGNVSRALNYPVNSEQ